MINLLFSPTVIFAYICYTIVSIVLLTTTMHVSDAVESSDANFWLYKTFSHWYIEHIWWPLSEIISLLVFILIAYPVLFDIENIPGLFDLMNQERINTLTNTLFFFTLLLPLIPVIGRLIFVILPLQSCFALGIIFSWIVSSHITNTEINYLPNLNTTITICVIAYFGHILSVQIGKRLGPYLDDTYHRQGFTDFVYHVCLMLFQAPSIIAYGHYLGQQLKA